jgi:hypothetical protein
MLRIVIEKTYIKKLESSSWGNIVKINFEILTIFY